MLNKKFISSITAICFVTFLSVMFTACSGSTNSSSSTDSSSMQAAPADTSNMQAAPMDTSMQMDTSKMDTASTRPVKNPHKSSK